MNYTYSITNDTLDGTVDAGYLQSVLDDTATFAVDEVEVRYGGDELIVKTSAALTTAEETELDSFVSNTTANAPFVLEQQITDKRNHEGLTLYKKIFAHISATSPVSSIDGFIAISSKLHTLRNFMKDGNFETAVRWMYTEIIPLNAFPNQELYRTWIREMAKDYNNALSDAVLDAIEQAPEGSV